MIRALAEVAGLDPEETVSVRVELAEKSLELVRSSIKLLKSVLRRFQKNFASHNWTLLKRGGSGIHSYLGRQQQI